MSGSLNLPSARDLGIAALVIAIIAVGAALTVALLAGRQHIAQRDATIKRLNGTIQDLEARNKRSEEFALDPYRRDATIQQLNRDLSVCTHSVQRLTDQINDIPECKAKIAH